MEEKATDRVSWQQAARLNHADALDRYRNVAPLFGQIEVDPKAILTACRMHMFTRRARGSKLFDMGKVLGGDWDLRFAGLDNPRLCDDKVIVATRRRYRESASWEETGIIEHKLFQIARSPRGVIDGCCTRDDLLRRYAALDEVAISIQKSGYLAEGNLEHRRGKSLDEISVSIGRGGEFLLATGGLHRLGILLALDHGAIPVHVLSRHEAWQERRDMLQLGGDHPDLL